MCCSPEEPDQRSVYGESRGVSPVFLHPKLKAAVRRAPTVPPELRAEEDREEMRGGGETAGYMGSLIPGRESRSAPTITTYPSTRPTTPIKKSTSINAHSWLINLSVPLKRDGMTSGEGTRATEERKAKKKRKEREGGTGQIGRAHV